MSNARVVVEGLSKDFHRVGRSRKGAGRGFDLRRIFGVGRRRENLHALRDISFSVGPGEMLGVIGANGAGKSTLLRMLGGLGKPTRGRVEVTGRIGALLDLGGSFLSDLTGRENAMLAGVVAGLTRREMSARMQAIVSFAGLEDFLEEPLRVYSAGMMMRLAFSVAIHTDPEVLLVDEYLSVGDLAFQAKCSARIREIREGGCAIVLVSHSMDQVRQLCDRALWLRDGRAAAFDSAQVVTTAFETEMQAETLRRTPDAQPVRTSGGRLLRMHETRFGSLEAEIENVRVQPGSIRSGGSLVVELEYTAKQEITSPAVVVSITREDGTLCLDTNTQLARVAVPDLFGGGCIALKIERLELGAGRYFVNVGIFENQWSHAYDYHFNVYPLVVDGADGHRGLLAPRCQWELRPGVAKSGNQ